LQIFNRERRNFLKNFFFVFREIRFRFFHFPRFSFIKSFHNWKQTQLKSSEPYLLKRNLRVVSLIS